MSKFNCKHNWEIGLEYRVGKDSIVVCQKCNLVISFNEAMQFELWKHSIGVSTRLAMYSLLIACLAIFVSLLK